MGLWADDAHQELKLLVPDGGAMAARMAGVVITTAVLRLQVQMDTSQKLIDSKVDHPQ